MQSLVYTLVFDFEKGFTKINLNLRSIRSIQKCIRSLSERQKIIAHKMRSVRNNYIKVFAAIESSKIIMKLKNRGITLFFAKYSS